MIQRVQTIFLFLAFIAGLLSFFFPIAHFSIDENWIVLGLFGIENYSTMTVSINTIPLIAIMGLISLIAFVTIFLFKNRIAQIRILRFGVLLNVVYLVLLFFFYVPDIEEATGTTAEYITQPGIYFPIAILAFFLLASRFIMKDEKLIRSADRIR
ncbi:MAG: DUF4293 domain-containing protein [Bacteroidota bacterium]|nr:DUF4293 domain-containing protein [Bacteroidota bacterium]